MIYFFSSKTRNTETFVKTLGTKVKEIKKGLLATEPFVLAVATYADANGKHPIPPQVIQFIKDNNSLLRGVISGGNRNFGRLYGLSGDIIARNCSVPLLHKFELRGTINDTQVVNNKLRELSW